MGLSILILLKFNKKEDIFFTFLRNITYIEKRRPYIKESGKASERNMPQKMIQVFLQKEKSHR